MSSDVLPRCCSGVAFEIHYLDVSMNNGTKDELALNSTPKQDIESQHKEVTHKSDIKTLKALEWSRIYSLFRFNVTLEVILDI